MTSHFYIVLEFAKKIPEIPLQAHSCLLASGLTVSLRKAWFPRVPWAHLLNTGSHQLEAAAPGCWNDCRGSVFEVLPCSYLWAESEPVACSCHHLSQQAFEDVPPPTPCEGGQNRTKCGVPTEPSERLIRAWASTFSP